MRKVASWLLAVGSCVASMQAQNPTHAVGPIVQGKGLEYAPGRVIVTLRDGADPDAVAREHRVRPDFTYRNVLRGFAGTVSEAAHAGLVRDRRVVRVERDGIIRAAQTTRSWALDRIDQRTPALDNAYTRTYTGAGVTVYIVDTGIRFDHVEFGGRAVRGYDALGGDGSDCNGHGTHVAGTVGGTIYGAANQVTLVSARVLDCSGSGTSSGLIAALDWIVANRRLPGVVNISLGGPAVQAVDDAVNRAIGAGLAVVVAAGNEGADACGGSPARTSAALTIGASDQADVRASFSNYGACVDLFAPGVMIPGPYAGSSTELVYMSGTSSATPLVSGVAALVLQHYPSLTPARVTDTIKAHATRSIVTSALSSANHLVFSREINDGAVPIAPAPVDVAPAPNIVPVADFTGGCTNLACTFTDRSTDADGSIVRWAWDFGNGATSSAQNPSYSYPAAGTYTVRLTVTDDDGATGGASAAVTVSAPASAPAPSATISISTQTSRSGGKLTTTIRWSGATGANVDIYRNGVRIVTTPNDGTHQDVVRVSGSGTISYRVCLAGSSTCSATSSVRY